MRSNNVSSGKEKTSGSSDGLRKAKGKGKRKEREGKVDVSWRPDSICCCCEGISRGAAA